MKAAILAAGAFLCVASGAHAQSYADGVCSDLRAARPNLAAPIAVTGHQPVAEHGRIADRVTYWRCPALNVAGAQQHPVDAETVIPTDLRSPFED